MVTTRSSRPPRLEIESSRPVVMMVEDSPDDRRIYGDLLWYNGFNVFLAPDGGSARRTLSFLRPDIVLLDIGLPDGSGLELCAVLGALPGSPVPVVALSAHPSFEMEARALASGCARYVEKLLVTPFNVLQIVESVVGRAPPSGEGATPWLLEFPSGRGGRGGGRPV